MEAELLAIGSELTSGCTVNSNAAYLARRLEELGIRCRRHAAVPDEPAAIIDALTDALARAAVVIVTGGLGPTVDDLTMDAVSRATGRRLVMDAGAARQIRAFCRRYQRRVTTLALRQAAIPHGAAALPNPLGTAPGVWLPMDKAVLIALPGVPQEMRAIFEQSVAPRLAARPQGLPIASRTIRTAGVVELELQRLLLALPLPPTVSFGLYPNLGAVDIRLTTSGSRRRVIERRLDRLERALRRRLGAAVYGTDARTLEAAAGEALVRRRQTVAVAESCTGGSVLDRLTDVPGSSRYVLLGVVAYHNRMKTNLLGVSPALLARHGAVSAPVARAMARGARSASGATVGLAITGIAGPDGGTARKPVGLVYMAIADRRRTVVKRWQFHGDRRVIKDRAVQAALDWLRRWALGRAD